MHVFRLSLIARLAVALGLLCAVLAHAQAPADTTAGKAKSAIPVGGAYPAQSAAHPAGTVPAEAVNVRPPSKARAKAPARPSTPSGAGAEVSMIELQSVTSQRATSLQMSTNIAKATNDAAKTVAGNIGGGGSNSPPDCNPDPCVRKSKAK